MTGSTAQELLVRGIAALERRDAAGAAPLLAEAARLSPQNPWPLIALAVAHLDLGDEALALQKATQAEALNPPAEALTKLGLFYKQAGKFNCARDCLALATQKNPGLVMAWFNLRDLKTFAPGDPDIKKLEALEGLPAPQQAQVEFILGKAYLDAGDAPRAFDHYAKAHALKRAGSRYDIAHFERYIGNIIACFDAAAIRQLKGPKTLGSTRPIFIIGMPRSGSTLVDQILSCHPDVASLGETRAFQDAIPVVPNDEVPPGYFGERTPSLSKRFIAGLTPDVLGGVAAKYLASIPHSGTHTTDKMLFNFVWAGLTRLALPQAAIIHCTRDPLDMGLSIWRTPFAGNLPWASDQKDIARYYRAYQRLMAHWDSLFPGDIYSLSYEALVGSPEAETRRLIGHCGLPWNDACLQFHQSRRRVSTASDVQVRQPIHKDSVGIGQKYAAFLKPLIDTLEATA